MYGKHDQLENLIKIIWFDFWPSNSFGKELEDEIAINSKRTLIPIILEMTLGSMYSIVCILLPFFTTSLLLYQAWYPPGWNRNLFESIINILYSYVMIYIINTMICAYDLLYTSLCINCISQYQLLCHAVKFIGTRKEAEVIHKIQSKNDVENLPTVEGLEGNAMKLLIICAKHHQLLIR